MYVCIDLTKPKRDRPVLSSGHHKTIHTVIIKTYDINSGHEAQKGLDTKTDRQL
jgi:hypothetical protein